MSLDRILSGVRGISKHIGVSGGSALTGLQKGFVGGGFLEELFESLGELAPLLAKAFGNAAGEVSPEIANALKQVARTISQNLSSAISQLDDLPGPFSQAPLEALEDLRSLGGVLECLSFKLDSGSSTFDVPALEYVEVKIELVASSLLNLLTAVQGGESGAFLFRGVLEGLKDLFKSVISSSDGDLSKLLGEALIKNFLSLDLVEGLLSAAFERKSWFWADLPSGRIAGILHDWLNNERTFPFNEDTSTLKYCDDGKPWKAVLEREYRIRLVAAYDAYFAQRLATQIDSSLSHADGRVSFELLSDVVTVFFNETITFVLEPHCSPKFDLETPGFDDIGFRLGRLAAPQLHVPIKGLLGILLRGVSFISVNNSAFIELLASIVARFFSSILDAILANLNATFRVTGVYRLPDGPVGDVFYHWPTMEAIEGNICDQNARLLYVVLFRQPDLIRVSSDQCLAKLKNNDLIKSVARDIGAYLDMSYRMHMVAPRFFLSSVVDKVTIVRAEYKNGTLLIVATTDHTLDRFQPVLRAYFCCRMVVMRPGRRPVDPYTVRIPCRALPDDASVEIVSNLGGTAAQAILHVGSGRSLPSRVTAVSATASTRPVRHF